MQDAASKWRVMVYVDGFNLYFGMRQSGLQRYYWLDLCALSRGLIRENQILQQTKYFTAVVDVPPERRERQMIYLEALETVSGDALTVRYGRYQGHRASCRACGAAWTDWSEKKTDVNIAVEVMVDAFQNRFDTAILVTADSDVVPVIEAVHRLFPVKRMVVAFPPSRHSYELKTMADATIPLGRAKLAHAQLPDLVTKPNGVPLRRPPGWRRLPEAAVPASGAPPGGTL